MSVVLSKDSAFERSARRIQDKEHRWVADKIYHQVFGDVEIKRVDESPIEDAVGKALDILGVDLYVVFQNNTLLAGQEKFLSYSYRGFRTVTVSEHSWKHCAAQVYFCGYLTEDGRWFDPWVLLNWTNVMIATAQGGIKWRLTPSRGAYPSFWWAGIDNLPAFCIIASDLSGV